MTETLAIRKLDALQIDLGFSGYSLEHRDFNVQPGSTRRISGVDMTYVIIDADDNIVVKSETGIYDRVTGSVAESVHHHSGSILLENHGTDVEYVEFMVAVWHFPIEKEAFPAPISTNTPVNTPVNRV